MNGAHDFVAHRCPLCGGDNRCAMAAGSGDPAAPCWCRTATFPPTLLERLPDAARNVACICAACANPAAAAATGPAP